MRLFLMEYLTRHRLTIGYFLRLAHQRAFGRDVNPSEDEHRYLSTGVLPPYAVKFIHDLQEKPCDVTAEPKSPTE